MSFKSIAMTQKSKNTNKPASKNGEKPDNPYFLGKNKNGEPIIAKTENQKKLVDAMIANDVVFATGPAGTGKTYVGVMMAAKALQAKEVERIIITRPAVEAGENLGFLPGDLKEKVDPYLRPIYDALSDVMTSEKLGEYLDKKIIEIAPLAYMRGRTLSDAFVILDEAQNTTEPQIKMFLSRMGQTAKMYITGDVSQIDLPHRTRSGLKLALSSLDKLSGLSIIELDGEEDNQRHKMVAKMLGRMEQFVENRTQVEEKLAQEKAEQRRIAAEQNRGFAENKDHVIATMPAIQNGHATAPRLDS